MYILIIYNGLYLILISLSHAVEKERSTTPTTEKREKKEAVSEKKEKKELASAKKEKKEAAPVPAPAATPKKKAATPRKKANAVEELGQVMSPEGRRSMRLRTKVDEDE